MRDFSFGNLLTSYRSRLGWTQAQIANPDDPEALPISLRTYQGWENGERVPSDKWLRRIASFFQLTETEADLLYRAAGQVAPEIHNLPFPQNSLFTGRKTYIERLNQLLKENASLVITQPISISGLGGIGKTQLALEYAHRNYPKVYQAVLWANAADKITLEASYLSLAHLLNLPEKDEREVNRVVQAVKTWLEGHTSWLLVLDNADDLQLARSFLPIKPRVHILLTTRSQVLGNIAARIEIEAMEPEEGLLFLLRRSGIVRHETEPNTIDSNISNAATQLVGLLGGHPLALDQAGAYVEETGDSFATYMQIYHEQRHILLNERGSLGEEHPETVVVTFEICFKRARELYPIAADVLHLCSFLHPDDIPEEVLSQDNSLKLNMIMFDKAIAALRRYSLINRNAGKKLISVHRLIQAVQQDTMADETKKQWIQRAVQAVNAVLEFTQWTEFERYLPHALLCATWIKQEQMTFPEAMRLLDQTSYFLTERAQYAEAELLYKQALAIYEQYLRTEPLSTASSLNNLAALYFYQGKYAQAEPLYQRALAIKEEQLVPLYPSIAHSLNNLALLYSNQGKYAQAEPLYQRALAIYEQQLGPQHPNTAQSLNHLAGLYQDQGKYEQAEPLYQRALAIKEEALGPQHPSTAHSLNDLALLYQDQGKYAQAEPLYERALTIYEQQLGAQHPSMATGLNNLAALYFYQGKYEQAEPLYQRALAIKEEALGPQHPSMAQSLNNLALLYQEQGKYEQAESLYQRALSIYEQQLGPHHPSIAQSLNNLAALHQKQGKYSEVEPLYQRALRIWEEALGPQHPQLATPLNGLAALYQEQGKYEQAESLYQRALSIYEQQLGPQHPHTLVVRGNYAFLLQKIEQDGYT